LPEEKKPFIQSEIGSIPSDWNIRTLKDVCLNRKGAIISGPFGSNIGSRFFVEEGIPVIRGNNLTIDSTNFVDDGFVFITSEKAKELGTWAEQDDLVFTAAGTLGQIAIIPPKRKFDKYIISNKQLRARIDKNLMVPLFAFYWFQSKKMVEYINLRNTGSTIPLINLSVLKSLPIPVPSIQEQKAIVEVLSAIDSKIELNQCMNCTLEAVGAALFRRWFVDFEFPNQEGKPYKTTGGKMQYNEELQMEIPENWTAKRVGDLAKINEHSINRDFSFSAIEYIDIDSVEQGLIKKRQLLTLKNAPSRAKRIVKDEDIIISTVRPNLKHFAFIQGAKANTIVSTGFAVISAKLTSPKLLYYHLTSDRYTNYLSAIADSHTSTYPSFNPDIIYNTLIAHPIEEKNGVMAKLILDFERLLSCVFQKIHNNNEQNSVLSMLRDALLPKLMSGKIRVPINKENVEMAVT